MAHQFVFRWRYDRPLSLEQFQLRFPDDHSCAAYLAKKRWPDGFVCQGVPEVYARRLLDPEYVEPERRLYRRKSPPRPVLARSRSAFVFATH
jgi:hypothetical protein